MEIGQKCAHDLELKSRQDEQARLALAGNNPSAVLAGHVLERPDAGCADSDDATPLVKRAIDGRGSRFGNLKPLGFHLVIFHALRANGLKRPQAHVKREFAGLDATGA